MTFVASSGQLPPQGVENGAVSSGVECPSPPDTCLCQDYICVLEGKHVIIEPALMVFYQMLRGGNYNGITFYSTKNSHLKLKLKTLQRENQEWTNAALYHDKCQLTMLKGIQLSFHYRSFIPILPRSDMHPLEVASKSSKCYSFTSNETSPLPIDSKCS